MSTEPAISGRFESLPFARVAEGPADAGLRREAEVRGYAAGWAAGARRAEAMLAERAAELEAQAAAQTAAIAAADAARAARLAAVLAALDARAEQTADDARTALLAAAIELAEALLGRELADDELSARAIAARVIAADAERSVTRVRVHPAEASDVAVMLTGHAAAVVPDAGLARGDAIAELPAGHLDARISAAVERVRRAFAEGGAA
jgi:flagellar assembly protein FliH